MIQPIKPDRKKVIIDEYKKRGKLSTKLQKEVANMLEEGPIEEFIKVIPVDVLEDAFIKYNPKFKALLEAKKTGKMPTILDHKGNIKQRENNG